MSQVSQVNSVDIYENFLLFHGAQLRASGVPEHYFKSICNKLKNQIFDAGEYFQLLLLDYGDEERGEKDPVFTVMSLQDIKTDDPNAIFLIDHALTFKSDILRRQLLENPEIAKRLSIMMGLSADDNVDSIVANIWRFCNFYSINSQGASVEDSLPLWYVMDELGSGIVHNDTPNCRVVPFIYTAEQATYSLLFPIRNIDEGEQITRDYVEGFLDNRDLFLLPWQENDFSEESLEQKEPDMAYFLQGRIEESLPENIDTVPSLNGNQPLKVFSDYNLVRQYLTDPAFEVLNEDGNSEEADILWLTKHFKGFNELNKNFPNTFINQFPFENVVTIKDLLAIVCRRSIEKHHNADNLTTFPSWLPTTYNLKTELRQFVSFFQNREEKEFDNHWIVKPFNLARSLDTHITNNLSEIIRLSQTGPKIVQKYIENPVLYNRPEVGGKVKFDVRYVILLTSTEPLIGHIYKKFFLRFSNVPFAMNEFDVYEKHFTVMNYNENANLKQLKCEEFLNEWRDQYAKYPWDKIEDEICEMFQETFIGATKEKPPRGIANNPQSRGLYAADIMLSWEDSKIQPKLLEINFIPDCQRACEYYKDFYNEIFKLLFLGQNDSDIFRKFT
ncbi:CLUMA_CG003033, isoform A [Clunio marinus]|uniref:CLUMA_CG003033, isoform A n=1 Tax=Clunio marinus TaxID=568069 RepID=A0A1J1HP17_9DIPT|nr:CLUMA_CG003033, isoform A [Clunio marinus]